MRKEKDLQNTSKKKKMKKVVIRTTLNEDGLNIPIKRHKLAE